MRLLKGFSKAAATARYTLANLSEKEKKAGVIAASAGNHAQVDFLFFRRKTLASPTRPWPIMEVSWASQSPWSCRLSRPS